MTDPCPSTADVNGGEVSCGLLSGHEHEHEVICTIETGICPDNQETPFLVWWDDEGHAFVGSKKAVDTGRIGGWDD